MTMVRMVIRRRRRRRAGVEERRRTRGGGGRIRVEAQIDNTTTSVRTTTAVSSNLQAWSCSGRHAPTPRQRCGEARTRMSEAAEGSARKPSSGATAACASAEGVIGVCRCSRRSRRRHCGMRSRVVPAHASMNVTTSSVSMKQGKRNKWHKKTKRRPPKKWHAKPPSPPPPPGNITASPPPPPLGHLLPYMKRRRIERWIRIGRAVVVWLAVLALIARLSCYVLPLVVQYIDPPPERTPRVPPMWRVPERPVPDVGL